MDNATALAGLVAAIMLWRFKPFSEGEAAIRAAALFFVLLQGAFLPALMAQLWRTSTLETDQLLMTGQTKSLIPHAWRASPRFPISRRDIPVHRRRQSDVSQSRQILVVNFAHVKDPRERFRVEIHLWSHNALPQNAVGHFLVVWFVVRSLISSSEGFRLLHWTEYRWGSRCNVTQAGKRTNVPFGFGLRTVTLLSKRVLTSGTVRIACSSRFGRMTAISTSSGMISQQTSGVWSHSDRPRNNLLESICTSGQSTAPGRGAVRRRITPARLQQSGAAEPPRRAAATALTTSCAARAEPLIVLSS